MEEDIVTATSPSAGPIGGWSIDSAAAELLACEAERRDRPPFTDDWADLDVATGYRIQDLNLRHRLDRGERVVGVKLGLTSRAKQQQMGVDRPFVAWLTDAMQLSVGQPVPHDRLIHPRMEPEIVFVMGSRLEGPGVGTDEAMAAVARVHGGAEIIDSRFADFRFRAGDVVADNASSGAFVIGASALSPEALDLSAEGVSVEVDDTVVDSATGASVLGHPGTALALAANELADRGLAIEPGWIVLTGGMADAVPSTPDMTAACHFTHLGTIRLHGGRVPSESSGRA